MENISTMSDWVVAVSGPPDTVYEAEQFRLRLKFSSDYPAKPPKVYFIKPWLPQHVHVYPNGDICMSILGEDWRPNMTAESVVLSVLSMLANAKQKNKMMPSNSMDAGRVDTEPGQQNQWNYHDDRC
jgi:ubiquitin-conjugating enzyme E2 W